MEAAGLALSSVQSLLAALQCLQLNDIRSTFEYKSQLDDLQGTVEYLHSVLRDAAEIEQDLLSSQDKVQIDKIKDAVYEADDLFDEFVTLAQQNQLLKADGRVSEKFRSFFSLSSNPLSVAYRMNDGVKKIKKKLDAIATYKQFSFNHDPEPIRNRRPDTCSYVNQVDIVGRGDDLEKIVGMLIHPSDDDQRHNVSFLSIVGIGGLGKTALAQLVFNDPRVTSAFSWRSWTCVADQDQKKLDVKETVCKILDGREGSTMEQEQSQLREKLAGSTLEQEQSQLREKLAGERYLLVLDDVWTEKHIQWRDLLQYLIGGRRGSWIVVTTRSHKTAEIVGGEVHKLQGLSEENSWSLFQQSAFTSNQSSNPPDELVKIGRKVVDGCAGVPLAIKVVGSFLYGQDRGKWKLVQEMGLANIRQSDNDILPILKLSFHHLEAPLKSCFAYCALFPKDFEMKKEMLKSLWMAQGYVVPLDKGQSIEDACEEYFSILLRRCFFQDIQKDYYGEISCKIHDLMHDIPLDVSGKEIFYATDTIRGNLDKKVRHLLIASMRGYGHYSLLGKTHIRSHLHVNSYIKEDTQFSVDAVVANYRFLRALDLRSLGIKSLSGCIGELLHLRYYNGGEDEQLSLMEDLHPHSNLERLSVWYYNGVKMPGWLTLVQNMVCLELNRCGELEYLPCLGKLCNLKFIHLDYLEKLEYIGVDDSSWANSSTTMPMCMLGSSDKELSFFPSLEQVDVWNLPKLKGWKRGVVGQVEDNNSGNNLKSQQLLACFSKLQELDIKNCPVLTCFPSCPDLEKLSLSNFNEGLQIMNKKRDEVTPASSSSSTSGYEIVNPKLQSLSTLTLWWGNEVDMPNWVQFLPALQTLNIYGCSALIEIPKWMPKLTSLTTLRLRGCSESLKRRCQKDPPGYDWPYIQHIPIIQF